MYETAAILVPLSLHISSVSSSSSSSIQSRIIILAPRPSPFPFTNSSPSQASLSATAACTPASVRLCGRGDPRRPPSRRGAAPRGAALPRNGGALPPRVRGLYSSGCNAVVAGAASAGQPHHFLERKSKPLGVTARRQYGVQVRLVLPAASSWWAGVEWSPATPVD